MGFEQRIQERRFSALLESMKSAIAAGDPVAARAALDEARELRPAAPELTALAARIAAIPLGESASAIRLVTIRTLSAAAMLLFGVSLITGLDYMRSTTPAAPPSMRVTTPLALAPVASIDTPARSAVPVADTAAGRTLLEPLGTSGIDARSDDEPLPQSLRPLNDHFEPPPPGEVPDDFVSPAAPINLVPRSSRAVPLAPLTNAGRISPTPPPPVIAPLAPSLPAVVTAAAAAPVRDDQRLVSGVLDAYARAYGRLDAAAAHEVWPSVDERALARAFGSLQSQTIAFDDCQIDVNGTAASATCRGRASYVGKVGSRDPRVEARQWRFDLRRDGDAWTIANAETRRQ
jgi:hypothetical protein